MSPALTPLVSALERAAALIEKGMPPAKAMRQVVAEIEEYEAAHIGGQIPSRPFQLGIRH